MGSYERRLADIEARLTKLEPKKKAREIAEEISEETRAPQHLGKKSATVIIQEYFSIKNSFKPQTMSNKDKAEFLNKLFILHNDLRSDVFPPDNPERIKMVLEVEKMLGQLR